jgi:SagB-type dehydrogenase family enzyme
VSGGVESGALLFVGGYRRVSAEKAEVQDPVRRLRHELAGEPELLDVIERALLACDGRFGIRDLVPASLDDPMLEAGLVESLEQLVDLSLLVDADDASEYAFHLIARLRDADAARVADAYASPRWVDPRAVDSGDADIPHRAPAARERPASLTAAQLETATSGGVRAVGPSESEVADLLRHAYGWSGGHRVVPSAGAFWPLVFHSMTELPDRGRLGVSWYDDATESLRSLESSVSKSELCRSMSPNPLIDLALDGSASFITISAHLARAEHKYGTRALHFALMEAGAVVQRMYDYTADTHYGVRVMGGFSSRRISGLLNADGALPLAIIIFAAGITRPDD